MFLTRKLQLNVGNVGDVVRIDYGKNKSEGDTRRVVRILSRRDTKEYPVLAETMRRNQIDRSRYLFDVQDVRSGQIRRFYGEEIAENARRYTLIGRIGLRLGVL